MCNDLGAIEFLLCKIERIPIIDIAIYILKLRQIVIHVTLKCAFQMRKKCRFKRHRHATCDFFIVTKCFSKLGSSFINVELYLIKMTRNVEHLRIVAVHRGNNRA